MAKMKDVKELEFVFENTDSMTFDINDVGIMEMSDIKTTVSSLAVNCIAKTTTANEVYIEIFKRANMIYEPFPHMNLTPECRAEWNDEACEKFTRLLECPDIAIINVKYTDDSVDEFFVNYNGEETNMDEEIKLSQFGHLYIVISKSKKKVFDIFPEDEFFSDSCKPELEFRTKANGAI